MSQNIEWNFNNWLFMKIPQFLSPADVPIVFWNIHVKMKYFLKIWLIEKTLWMTMFFKWTENSYCKNLESLFSNRTMLIFLNRIKFCHPIQLNERFLDCSQSTLKTLTTVDVDYVESELKQFLYTVCLLLKSQLECTNQYLAHHQWVKVENTRLVDACSYDNSNY